MRLASASAARTHGACSLEVYRHSMDPQGEAEKSQQETRGFCPPPQCFGLGQLTRHNVLMLKELNLATIPVVYGEDYYSFVVANPTYCRLAYLGDVLVGGITCRVDLDSSGAMQLYIMTLSVLKPYRRYGVATQLLGYILDLAGSRGDIKKAALHVWKANREAQDFYRKRGFKFVRRLENHYPDMLPPDAYLLECPLPWELKNRAPLLQADFDATKHNLSRFK